MVTDFVILVFIFENMHMKWNGNSCWYGHVLEPRSWPLMTSDKSVCMIMNIMYWYWTGHSIQISNQIIGLNNILLDIKVMNKRNIDAKNIYNVVGNSLFSIVICFKLANKEDVCQYFIYGCHSWNMGSSIT